MTNYTQDFGFKVTEETKSANGEFVFNNAHYTNLHVDALRLSNKLNRRVDAERVKQIVAHFDTRAVRPLVVAKIKGESKYQILDGQHTFLALKTLGFENIPCFLYTNMTPQECVHIINLHNQLRHNMTYRQSVRVSKGWKAGEEYELDQCVKDLGITHIHGRQKVMEIWRGFSDKEAFKRLVQRYQEMCRGVGIDPDRLHSSKSLRARHLNPRYSFEIQYALLERE